MSQSFLLKAVLCLTFVAPLSGCGSGPGAVHQPQINASDAAYQALEMHDTNGDGRIAGQELDTAPELKSALSRIDTNDDDGISADEISARIEEWKQMGVGLTTFRFQVLLNGQPLQNAEVVFEPAPYLGGDIKRGVATTDASGFGIASVPKVERPSPETPPGMALGLYKVKVMKPAGGQQQIPPRFNDETTLGQEVAFDVPEIQANRVVYELRN